MVKPTKCTNSIWLEEYVTFKYMQSVDQNYYKEKNLENEKYYWKNGERYVGEFEQFSLHGYGVRYNSDGLIMQHGFYIHDTYDGLALAA